ncbi:MAG TPA: TonB family protein [Pyrinomonadaceae bacterium]|jgi:TonB family protein
MKNLITFCLGVFILFFGAAGCKNNPLAKFTNQYRCSIAGEPDLLTSDDYVKRGYKHIELDNYSDKFDECAFGAAQEALKLDPKNTRALGLRGTLYRMKNEYDAALEDFNEAIRLAPDNPSFYIFRSNIYELQNKLDKAIEDMTTTIQKSGSNYDYSYRAKLYFKKEDYENALKDYTEAIRQNPGYENYYTLRAEVYRKMGKTALAEADELKAKDLESSDSNSPPVLTDSSSTGNSDSKTISGGVVNGRATNLVQPAYPPAARAVRASGAVNVQVTIDEKGTVVAASAVSGHPLLRAAAVQAARASKFSPTMLSGKPVRVSGVIVYNFVP